MEAYTPLQWLLIFFVYSVLGWVWESCYVSVISKRCVNRGVLHGPWLPIYGAGAVVVLLVTLPARGRPALIFLLDLVPSAKPPYLLVVNSTDTEIDPALNELLNRYAKGARVKSRSVSADRLDLILELRTDDGSRLVSACAALPGVESVNLLAHDGEVRY